MPRKRKRRSKVDVGSLMRLFMSLEGRHVLGWEAEEVAIREEESAAGVAAEFEDPCVTFLQLNRLDLELDDEELVAIGTYRDGGKHGLWPHCPARRLVPNAQAGVLRTRRLDDLPLGRVRSVDVGASLSGTLNQVTLTVGDELVVLLPGEVDEDWEGALRVKLGRECLLLFTDPFDADDVREAAAAREPLAPGSLFDE